MSPAHADQWKLLGVSVKPLGGLHMIEGLPLFADSTDGMASVAAYTYHQHSVLFIGTRSGNLKKVGPRTPFCIDIGNVFSHYGKKGWGTECAHEPRLL